MDPDEAQTTLHLWVPGKPSSVSSALAKTPLLRDVSAAFSSSRLR